MRRNLGQHHWSACLSAETSRRLFAYLPAFGPTYLPPGLPTTYLPSGLPACLTAYLFCGDISENTTALPAYLRGRPEGYSPTYLPPGLPTTYLPNGLPVFAEKSRTIPLICLLTCGDVSTIIRLPTYLPPGLPTYLPDGLPRPTYLPTWRPTPSYLPTCFKHDYPTTHDGWQRRLAWYGLGPCKRKSLKGRTLQFGLAIEDGKDSTSSLSMST